MDDQTIQARNLIQKHLPCPRSEATAIVLRVAVFPEAVRALARSSSLPSDQETAAAVRGIVDDALGRLEAAAAEPFPGTVVVAGDITKSGVTFSTADGTLAPDCQPPEVAPPADLPPDVSGDTGTTPDPNFLNHEP